MQRVLLAVLILLVGAGAYLLGKNQLNHKQAGLTESSPTTSACGQQMKNYVSGQSTYGLSINYGNGWIVRCKVESNLGSDYKGKVRLDFDFAPVGWKIPAQTYGDWMGWGEVFIDVYDPQTNIDQWISKYSPNNIKNLNVLQEATSARVSDKPTYSISSTVSEFGAIVVLGTDYSYDIGHSQNGTDDFVKVFGYDKYGNNGKIFSYIQIN